MNINGHTFMVTEDAFGKGWRRVQCACGYNVLAAPWLTADELVDRAAITACALATSFRHGTVSPEARRERRARLRR